MSIEIMSGISWEIFPLLVGFILSYILYHYRQYRLGGVIAIPLLAVYTIKAPVVALVTIILSVLIFLILEFLLERKVIYGRRLLYVSLIFSIILSGLANLLSNSTGWYALLLSGLMAYNYHRESHSDVRLIKSLLSALVVYLVCVVYAWSFFLILG